jgi:NitT/TauT family transport system substrate-binding protein
MKKIKLFFAGLICIALLLSACSSNKTSVVPDNTSVTEPNKEAVVTEAPKEIIKMKAGYAPGIGNLLSFIADDSGIFAKEGIDVELVPFSNSSDGLNALNAGKIDIGVSFGTAAPLTFVTQGVDFSFFGGYLSGGHPVLAKADLEYNSIEDFKGKTVATARLYTPDIAWRTAMLNAGIDIEKDLTVIEVKRPADMLEIIKSGKADIGIGTGSIYAKAIESDLKAITWSNDLLDNHVCCRPVAKTAWINENPELAKAFLRSFIQAEKIYVENPEYAVDVNAKYLELDHELARILTLESNQIIEADPKSHGIQEMWQGLHDIDYLNSPDIDVNNHINTLLYKKALDELTAENPNDPFYAKLQTRYSTNNE